MEDTKLTIVDALRKSWIWFLSSKTAKYTRGCIFAVIAIYYACIQMSAAFMPAVPEKPFTYEIYLPQNYAILTNWDSGGLAVSDVDVDTYKTKEKDYRLHYAGIKNSANAIEIWYYAKNENSTHVERAVYRIKNPDANTWSYYQLKDVKFNQAAGNISAQGAYEYHDRTNVLYFFGIVGAALFGAVTNIPVTMLCRRIYRSYFEGK